MRAKEVVMAMVDRLLGVEPALKIESFSYSSNETPKGYACGVCGRAGVKLWREYQTFLDHQTLSCVDCALKRAEENNKDGKGCRYQGPADVQGMVTVHYSVHGASHLTDQIGWLVPAVPTEDGETFWGYSSVPQPGVEWWKRLPTYPIPQG